MLDNKNFKRDEQGQQIPFTSSVDVLKKKERNRPHFLCGLQVEKGASKQEGGGREGIRFQPPPHSLRLVQHRLADCS
jgi:hypothetical protein